jgi:hypothetical protein
MGTIVNAFDPDDEDRGDEELPAGANCTEQ